MRQAFDWVFGITSLLLGLGLIAWIAYNLLIERQPETRGSNPVVPVLFAGACIYVGIQRIRRGMRRSPPG